MKYQLSVCVIDNEVTFRRAFKSILEKYGFDVKLAYTGNMAISKIKRYSVDAVIFDIVMNSGGMDGFEVLKHIRELKPSMYIEVLTACEEHLRVAKEKGADSATLKPIEEYPLYVDKLKRGILRKLIETAAIQQKCDVYDAYRLTQYILGTEIPSSVIMDEEIVLSRTERIINDMRDLEKEYELGDIRAIATAYAKLESSAEQLWANCDNSFEYRRQISLMLLKAIRKVKPEDLQSRHLLAYNKIFSLLEKPTLKSEDVDYCDDILLEHGIDIVIELDQALLEKYDSHYEMDTTG